jgi:ABC-type transporter MlaC component
MALLTASLGWASKPGEPTAVIQKTVDQVLEVLRDKNLQVPSRRKERLAKIRVIADDIFAWDLMAMRSLGPTWRDLDDDKRSRFVSAFREILADQYLDDMDNFQGTETVDVHGAKSQGGHWSVETTLITHSRERVPIHYFMHKGEAGWRVHDFSVEGVSLVNHYRKSFRRFLVNESFDALLRRLERKSAAVSR